MNDLHVKCDADLVRLGNEADRLSAKVEELTTAVDITARTVTKASAWWYVCGYNDNRAEGQPWVDADAFMDVWVALNEQASRPSLQDAFRAFMKDAAAS